MSLKQFKYLSSLKVFTLKKTGIKSTVLLMTLEYRVCYTKYSKESFNR